jgi:hypothetical protein
MLERTRRVIANNSHSTFKPFTHRVAVVGVTLALFAAGACNDSVTTPKSQVPAVILILAGDAQHAQVASNAGIPLTVEVRDKNNIPMPGAIVNFSTTSNGSLGAPSVPTDSAGDASVIFTMGTTAGAMVVTASVDGVATPVTFTLVANPGPPQTLDPETTTQETGTVGAPLTTPFEIKVVDLFGNPIAGVTVTWSATGGTLGATSSVTDQDGNASVSFTPGAGTQTVTANVPNVTTVSFVAVGI